MLRIKLAETNTRAPKKFSKSEVKKKLKQLKCELEQLQNLMFAEGKRSLLIIIQGMDASGKDGTIKNVFDAVDPMGCRVIAFKEPSSLELKHDFLWRIHQQVPEKGTIHIFNRSHYEDVTIQRVHKVINKRTLKQRYNHINNFERLLVESNTLVLKFYLHISKEEQLERLQERMKDPQKMWKHDDKDMKERELWNEYTSAYEDVFQQCSKYVKWHIVPADQNWYKEYFIAKKIVEILKKQRMKFPRLDENGSDKKL